MASWESFQNFSFERVKSGLLDPTRPGFVVKLWNPDSPIEAVDVSAQHRSFPVPAFPMAFERERKVQDGEGGQLTSGHVRQPQAVGPRHGDGAQRPVDDGLPPRVEPVHVAPASEQPVLVVPGRTVQCRVGYLVVNYLTQTREGDAFNIFCSLYGVYRFIGRDKIFRRINICTIQATPSWPSHKLSLVV